MNVLIVIVDDRALPAVAFEADEEPLPQAATPLARASDAAMQARRMPGLISRP
jgi:hypothetical protein